VRRLVVRARPGAVLSAVRLCTVLLCIALVCAACAGEPTEAPARRESGLSTRAPIPVVVSIPPLAWLVDRLGGDRVETRVLLPPGASPVTYEPTPRQVVELDRARLVVAVGDPDFAFEHRLLRRLLAHRPELPVLEMTAALTGAGGPPGLLAKDHGDGDAEIDPHVWVAPETMAAIAGPVADSLRRSDPEHAAGYLDRLTGLREEIAALNRELTAAFADLPRRRFWVYHPAWGYLARQYGLEQVALEAGGKDLSAARLVQLTEQARREGVRVIFVQRGFSDRAARALAAQIGARVEVLDPLARDWPENLRQVAAKLRAAMASPPSGSLPAEPIR
jgi:zinc transport system substrate-binding protein